ncbi:MAG: hypothetical protein K2X67_11455 [Burkholderiales bacterium]|nr:hypothetical protein [Burkholderiales bacterium]
MIIDSTNVPAVAVLMGSLVGASATVATAWFSQRTLHKRDLLQAETRKREALYGEFIGECAKLLMDSFIHTLDHPDKLLPMYALLNRIRLCGSPAVLAEAERLLRLITEQYFAANLTVEDLRELAGSEEADPLRAFGEACRAELESIGGAM